MTLPMSSRMAGSASCGRAQPRCAGAVRAPACRRSSCGRLRLRAAGRRAHRSARAAAPGPRRRSSMHRWRGARAASCSAATSASPRPISTATGRRPDLPALLELLLANEAALESRRTPRPGRARSAIASGIGCTPIRGAAAGATSPRITISATPSIAQWLDRGMTYSSALYRGGRDASRRRRTPSSTASSSCSSFGRRPSVLEIGCGWGALAERLAGVSGARHAASRCRASSSPTRGSGCRGVGSAGRATSGCRTIATSTGRFDRIVSIEMIEAVGEAYWPIYFDTLRAALAPGGVAVLQVITIADDRFDAYRARPRLHPAPHLPRRHAADGRAAHRARQPARRACRCRAARSFGASYAAHAGRLATPLPAGLAGDRSRSASTNASGGCGTTTSPIARPDSATPPSTSTCSS